jgi:hypothetical protein
MGPPFEVILQMGDLPLDVPKHNRGFPSCCRDGVRGVSAVCDLGKET